MPPLTEIKRFSTLPYFLLVLVILLTAASASFAGNVQRARMTADGSDLRQIAQASIIYAQDHQDRLPAATDVWDYATILAAEGILDAPQMWQSKLDPATDENSATFFSRKTTLTNTSGRRQADPEFRKLKLSVAVPVGVPFKINALDDTNLTPIAWTRGLQSDGTWAGHSPYGQRGGYISFANGQVLFFKNLGGDGTGELTRFDGKGKTANILEALPPGMRISEYTPTAEEKALWSEASRTSFFQENSGIIFLLIFLVGLWGPFVFISIHRARHKKSGSIQVLIWPAFLTFILAIINPMC